MRSVLGFLGPVILLFATQMLTALHQPAAAETILVSEDSPGGPYDWPLWVAIDAAAPGDTIRVAGGNYMGGLRIDKPLTLLGAEVYSTWVHGDHSYSSVFVITAEAVTIEGFHLSGCRDRNFGCPTIDCRGCSAMLRHNMIRGDSSIRITGDSRITINYNELHFASYGIESRYNSHPVDARFNWWGTTMDEDEIKKVISSNRGKIEYSPWLQNQDVDAVKPRPWLQNQDAVFTKTSTLISTISWGWLKRKGR